MNKKNELKRGVAMTVQRREKLVSELIEIDHICYVFE